MLGSLVMQAADGSGGPERLTDGERIQRASLVLADGSGILFSDGTGPRLLRLDAKDAASPLLRLAQGGGDAMISPDGRWMAYVAVDSGTPQSLRELRSRRQARQKAGDARGRLAAEVGRAMDERCSTRVSTGGS